MLNVTKDNLASWPPIEYGHILLLCPTSWTVYTARAHAVEELGSI